MAKNHLLECLEKRDLLNEDGASEATLLGWGRRFEEAGLLNDAVEFYDRADSSEDLKRLLESALEEGDLFLYTKLSRILKHDPSRDEWLVLADRAEAAGKFTFAADARRRGGGVEEGGEPG